METCPLCGNARAEAAEECGCGYKFQTVSESVNAPKPYEGSATTSPPGSNLFGTGWSFIGISLTLIFISIKFETAVDTQIPYASGLLSGLTRTESVQNIGLLQLQMMIFLSGCGLFLSGIICLSAASIVKSNHSP